VAPGQPLPETHPLFWSEAFRLLLRHSPVAGSPTSYGSVLAEHVDTAQIACPRFLQPVACEIFSAGEGAPRGAPRSGMAATWPAWAWGAGGHGACFSAGEEALSSGMAATWPAWAWGAGGHGAYFSACEGAQRSGMAATWPAWAWGAGGHGACFSAGEGMPPGLCPPETCQLLPCGALFFIGGHSILEVHTCA